MTTPQAIALAMTLPFLLALLLSRRVRRAVRGTGSLRQTASNAGVGLLFLSSQALLRGALVAVFAGVAALVPWKLPAHHPATYAIAFVLLDLVYYFQHRLEHRVPLLWAIHAVHHQSVDYNWSVSFRVGALASLTTACFHSLLAFAGVDPVTYAAVGVSHAVLLFCLHSPTTFTVGPGRFFNAPVFHRVHHASNDEALDRNFGGVFLVFDRLFETFAPDQPGLVYGVKGEAVPADPVGANIAPWLTLAAAVARQNTWRSRLRALFVPAGG